MNQPPVERLFDAMASFTDWPEGVVPLPARLTNFAFFPGGSGVPGVDAGMKPRVPDE